MHHGPRPQSGDARSSASDFSLASIMRHRERPHRGGDVCSSFRPTASRMSTRAAGPGAERRRARSFFRPASVGRHQGRRATWRQGPSRSTEADGTTSLRVVRRGRDRERPPTVRPGVRGSAATSRRAPWPRSSGCCQRVTNLQHPVHRQGFGHAGFPAPMPPRAARAPVENRCQAPSVHLHVSRPRATHASAIARTTGACSGWARTNSVWSGRRAVRARTVRSAYAASARPARGRPLRWWGRSAAGRLPTASRAGGTSASALRV